MHEVVRSNLHTRLFRSLRFPSVAGNGLPERMRTTAFAFLGLTAALGLALVAIFAQLSFPVLSPAPAPSGPLDRGTVSEAVALDHGPAAFVPAGGGEGGSRPAVNTDGRSTGGETQQTGEVAAPTPAPAPSGEPSGSGGVPSTPAPPPAPGPAPSSEEPSPSGQPDPAAPSKPKPTPARPATPKPEPAPAPGNSQSSAAAEHASERGIEASSKSTTAAVAPEAAPEDEPGNGKGKALGHSK
jgi:outer membrane biosynthesis protein TonB